MPKSSATSVPDYPIERRIHMVRGQKIMLDSDLAELYGVQTKRLNEAVKLPACR
jgi:ORF6N domain